ncbi:Magnetosome protein MamT [Azospirillaceae bacterium]
MVEPFGENAVKLWRWLNQRLQNLLQWVENRWGHPALLALVAAAVIIAPLFFITLGKAVIGNARDVPMRIVDGDYFGALPRPVSPWLIDPLLRMFQKQDKFRLMTIRRIPPIQAGGGMPHPYVGVCTNCHLYVGGPGPGSQHKTPVGAILEQLSRLHKLGPPIWPDAEMPHPSAGRCIKCHDIVVKVPVDPKSSGFIWQY